MFVVGLTGGIGSGKSTVAQLFAEKNIVIIDTDQLSRYLTLPGMPAFFEIEKLFGADILNPNGTLDRTKLREIIFADDVKRRQLEQLLHPLIRAEMKLQAEAADSPYCIVVIPLLFETEPNPLIQRILVVDTTEELQLARTTLRDKNSENQITAIIKTQVSREKRLSLTHDIIHNDGILEDLAPQVNRLHKLYLSLAKNT
jgi:dephospho-CoA kinase